MANTKQAKQFEGATKQASGDARLTPSLLIRCYACDKPSEDNQLVDTRDGQTVFVGPVCYSKIKKAGERGYQPPLGGPRLWLIVPVSAQIEATRAAIRTMQADHDRDATQRMIDNPDATLAHAMTHLFAVSGEYAPYTYWRAITTLQDLRNALCQIRRIK